MQSERDSKPHLIIQLQLIFYLISFISNDFSFFTDAEERKQEKLDSPCAFRIPKLCRNKRNKNEEGSLNEHFNY